jgi:methyl-accepting chemotaxis protein
MMNEQQESRLDRLEALAESILAGLQETRQALQETQQGLRETRAIANSNAKSIEALSNSITEAKAEWEKDRRGLYQLLGQLTRSMSDFYNVQSDFYLRFDQIDDRQARMLEILNRYLPPE